MAYIPSMNAEPDTAYRLRWTLLAVALAFLLAGIYWTTGPLLSGDGARLAPLYLLPTSVLADTLEGDSGTDDVRPVVVLFLGLLLVTQWMFLRPRRGFRVRMGEEARPLKTAVAAAAFMAAMLSVAAIAVVLEVFHAWNDVLNGLDERVALIAVLWFAVWLLWATVFYVYWKKGTHFEQWRAMARGLIVGSMLELFVASGVFVWKSDDDNCWCGRGSYTGLVFGATVMIWAFGPGLVLLFFREARYRRKAESSSGVD
jgi:hypothetical protein